MAYVDSSARIVDFIAVINVESNYHPMAKRRESLSLFWVAEHTHPPTAGGGGGGGGDERRSRMIGHVRWRQSRTLISVPIKPQEDVLVEQKRSMTAGGKVSLISDFFLAPPPLPHFRLTFSRLVVEEFEFHLLRHDETFLG